MAIDLSNTRAVVPELPTVTGEATGKGHAASTHGIRTHAPHMHCLCLWIPSGARQYPTRSNCIQQHAGCGYELHFRPSGNHC